MARRIGCKSADADRDFLDHNRGMFIGALRFAEIRSLLTASLASSPLVMFSTVCARQAIEAAKLSAAAFIWVEKTSLVLIDIVERDFDDYDDYQDEAGPTRSLCRSRSLPRGLRCAPPGRSGRLRECLRMIVIGEISRRAPMSRCIVTAGRALEARARWQRCFPS
jgi:hypothetical protein